MKVDGKGAKRNRSVCLTAQSWSWRLFAFLHRFCPRKEEEIVIVGSLSQEQEAGIVMRCFLVSLGSNSKMNQIRYANYALSNPKDFVPEYSPKNTPNIKRECRTAGV